VVRRHQQDDVEKRLNVVPVQVKGTYSDEQFVRHVWWGPGPLLGRLCVVGVQRLRP